MTHATGIASRRETFDDGMRVLRCMITAIVCVTVGHAHADPVVLFEEGRAYLDQDDYDRGCPKFEQAYEQAPERAGIEANLAACAEHFGDLTRAWKLYTNAAQKFAKDPKDPRGSDARKKAEAVAARATWVVLGLSDPGLEGLTLSINGRKVAPSREVRELVPAGEVTLVAKATGKKTWRRTVEGQPRDTVVVEVALADLGDEVAVAEPTPTTRRRRSRVYLSIGLGAVAIGALATSYFVGRSASEDYDDIMGDPMYCMAENCTREGQRLIDETQDRATKGTIIGIGGAVFAVGAVVVFFTAPKDTIITPQVSSSGGGVTFSARF
jgi:hypothetical protein